MSPLWRITYYVSEGGDVPFLEFISRLTTRLQKAECKALIELLRKRGDTLHGNKYLTYDNGLREIHGKAVRIFYKCEQAHLVVVIDGLLPGQTGEDFDDIRRKADDYASQE